MLLLVVVIIIIDGGDVMVDECGDFFPSARFACKWTDFNSRRWYLEWKLILNADDDNIDNNNNNNDNDDNADGKKLIITHVW